jgi:CBS domain containing-hemolysin-like protein
VTLTSPAMRVVQELSLLDAISAMRAERAQLVLVEGEQGPIGLVTMEDLLERVLGQFDDETDTSNPETAIREGSTGSGATVTTVRARTR